MKARLKAAISLIDRLQSQINAEQRIPGQADRLHLGMELSQAMRRMVEEVDSQDKRLEELEEEMARLKKA